MRVESVVLEHHRDVAILRRQVGDVAVADVDAALGNLFEASEHTKRGGLTTAGRADENHELAVLDLEVQLVNGIAVGAGVAARSFTKTYSGHATILSTGRYVPDDP